MATKKKLPDVPPAENCVDDFPHVQLPGFPYTTRGVDGVHHIATLMASTSGAAAGDVEEWEQTAKNAQRHSAADVH